jgi:hypothetical protein
LLISWLSSLFPSTVRVLWTTGFGLYEVEEFSFLWINFNFMLSSRYDFKWYTLDLMGQKWSGSLMTETFLSSKAIDIDIPPVNSSCEIVDA